MIFPFRLSLFFLLLLSFVVLAPFSVMAGDDGGDDLSRLEFIGGLPTVSLSEESQEQSGIEVIEALGVSYISQISAFGRVMDLGPLFALKERYGVARRRLGEAEAGLTYAALNLKRLKKLKGDVSTKALQKAEKEKRVSQAQVNGALGSLRALRGEVRAAWGNVVADMALSQGEADFKPFLDGEAQLLLVTLPPGKNLPRDPGGLETAVASNGEGGFSLTYISAAPMADPVIFGKTYFFAARSGQLRANMVLQVRLAGQGGRQEGVIVPREAVIWYSGKPWAYVQVDETHFLRRHIPQIEEADGGWFTADAVRPGEKLVRVGAQMLLSEEFRWQIDEEDDD